MYYRGFNITTCYDKGVERYNNAERREEICEGYFCEIYPAADDQYADQLDTFCLAVGHEIPDLSDQSVEAGVRKYVNENYYNLQQAAADARKAVEPQREDPKKGQFKPGDICLYSYEAEHNDSAAIVQIVRILNDPRGVAEVKFLEVLHDDTGNGLFHYLKKSGKTMNASFTFLTHKSESGFLNVESAQKGEPELSSYEKLKDLYDQFGYGAPILLMALRNIFLYGQMVKTIPTEAFGEYIDNNTRRKVQKMAVLMADMDLSPILAMIQRILPAVEGDGIDVPKLNNGHKDNVCPYCGTTVLYSGDKSFDDVDSISMDWRCPGCGATGTATYRGIFDGHMYLKPGPQFGGKCNA